MIVQGDARALPIASGTVQCCVTSPPYYGLRNYGAAGQIGIEPTGADYIAAIVGVFREVHRVMRDDGTLWLNLGDSYNAYNGGAGPGSKLSKTQTEQRPRLATGYGLNDKSLKPKDLMMIPARVALALQADGWYLRSDIIWSKPNPMPESVTDRPTKAHEYLFLLTKSERYFYDANAIAEPLAPSTLLEIERGGYDGEGQKDYAANGVQNPSDVKRRIVKNYNRLDRESHHARTKRHTCREGIDVKGGNQGTGTMPTCSGMTRNRRTVWTIPTRPFLGAHFATFPEQLVEPCVLAGSKSGDMVCDPFAGSGTVGVVCRRFARRFVGVELNPEYVAIARQRISAQQPGIPFEAIA